MILPDCGDNSCLYSGRKGGQRTNGGCGCDRCPTCNASIRPNRSPQTHRKWCTQQDWIPEHYCAMTYEKKLELFKSEGWNVNDWARRLALGYKYSWFDAFKRQSQLPFSTSQEECVVLNELMYHYSDNENEVQKEYAKTLKAYLDAHNVEFDIKLEKSYAH
jgi:hypothetical protein